MMKNLIKLNLFLILLGLFYFEACDSGVQSKGDSIHGNITFADTNFNTQGGKYAVALYTYNPPNSFYNAPVSVQNIDVSSSKTVNYTITNEGGGYYYAAVVWQDNNNPNEHPLILGIHGCDTSHNCNNAVPIAFPNYTGHSFDIVSWADTSKRLF